MKWWTPLQVVDPESTPMQSAADATRDALTSRTGGAESLGAFERSCAANTTSATSLLTECNLHGNFLGAASEPFMTITGGWLPLLFWSVLAMCIYLKYRSYLYALVFATAAFVGTGIWLPTEAQTYLFLGLATGIAAAIFTLLWRVPRDTA